MGDRRNSSTVNIINGLLNKLNNGHYDYFKTDSAKEDLYKILNNMQISLDFKEIGDNLYDGIYISDGEGKTLYVNKAYTRITGITADEVVGRYVSEIEQEGKLYKNPVTLEVLRQKKRVNSEGVSLKNGKKMLITGSPIFDEEGNIKKVVINNREMTDLLAIKAELEESIEKLKEVTKGEEKTRQEVEHLRKLSVTKLNIIGNSPGIHNVIKMIEKVENLDVTVLIIGETGVGKEVIANEIYVNSKRNNEPFIKLNCAAIPENLLESELFGYEKGAFTGANTSGKVGAFELANKGTILLDEIAEMPIELQSKLLRVIQQREIMRVGGTKPIKLDVRIIAATNKNLQEQIALKKFREDLFYRLNVIPIHVPPLRSRLEDIEPIANFFLDQFNKKYNRRVVLNRTCIEILKSYQWPGNIRELQNIIERLVVISDYKESVFETQLANMLSVDRHNVKTISCEQGLKEMVEQFERRVISQALREYGSTRKVATKLKLDQSTIVKKVKRLGIKLD